MATFPFPNKISSMSSNQLEQKAIVASYGDGYEQRMAMGINSIYDTWSVAINGLTATERSTMIAFYRSHGRVVSFNWTPPGESVSKKWVFNEALSETNNGCLYNFSMTLRQVFE